MRCVPLSELAADGIQLRPAEAAAVVAELCRQHAVGDIPGIPSAGIVRITPDGGVVAHGPMTREDAPVARAGHLLDDLLPGGDASATYRVSGRLRLVLARALGILDLPPFSGLDEFRAALIRFAGPDPVSTIRGLFQRWEQPVTALVPSGPQVMARIAAPMPARDRSGPFSFALGFFVASLLALGAIVIAAGSAQQGRFLPIGAPESNRFSGQAPVAAAPFAVTERNARPVASSAPAPAAVPAPVRKTRPAASSARVPAASAAGRPAIRPRARQAPQPRRETARPSSFFKRELFRIEIK